MSVDTKTVRFTDVFIKALAPTDLRIEFSDSVQIGLRLRVSPSGKKSFAMKARGADGRLRTVTLGSYPDISVKTARDQAAGIRTDLKSGKDINAQKRKLREAAAEAVTLRALLTEYATGPGKNIGVWKPRGPKTLRSEAQSRVEIVFSKLLDKRVEEITAKSLAEAMSNYKPVNAIKVSANGQVSKARSYLKPVLDWAANRGRFKRIGLGRSPQIDVADISETFDPATDDPKIKGIRDRVLDLDELKKLLPILHYPAPTRMRMGSAIQKDFRLIALRFILLTAARLDEVASMRWSDVHWTDKVWVKPDVKSKAIFKWQHRLPISESALAILHHLKKVQNPKPADRVFPNSNGGTLGNWVRVFKKIEQETGVTGFNRHDLRRTSATLMEQLRIPVSTIEEILDHSDRFKAAGGGKSAKNYLTGMKILDDIPDPVKEALDRLAQAYDKIEKASESDPVKKS